MTKETAVKHLKNAITILNRDGWCKGLYKTKEGKRCAWGALRYSTKNDNRVYNIQNLLQSNNILGHLGIIKFNDSCKTKKQVINFFNKAIKKLSA